VAYNESSKLEEYQEYCLLHSEKRLKKWWWKVLNWVFVIQK